MRLRLPATVWMVPVTAVACGAGFASGSRLLFPLLGMAPAYPVLVSNLLSGRRGRALGIMLLWAVTVAASGVGLCLAFPEKARHTVWNGPAYADEMFLWLETGEGAESRPSQFLVQHAIHAAVFVALSLATASLVSIFFGTLLLNYMSYYVARVIAAAGGQPLAILAAWHPWSAVRVVAFVILGVVLAEPMLGWLTGRGLRLRAAWPWLAAAAAGLAVDALMKAILAPTWRLWLRALTAMP